MSLHGSLRRSILLSTLDRVRNVSTRASCRPSPLVILGSRGSKLALAQTSQLMELLAGNFSELAPPDAVQMLTTVTAGDRNKSKDMRGLGAGAFTEEVDLLVLNNQADVAVHSLKDVPVLLARGLSLAACLPRADVRDAFISLKAKNLGELREGAVVGTASMRRRAQLLHHRPDLQVVTVRGNLDERMAALQRGDLDAIVLAMAGLQRLGLQERITSVLEVEEMVPAACQGAIGLVCRQDDEQTMRYLTGVNHVPTFLEVTCERAWLSAVTAAAPELPNFAVACSARYSETTQQLHVRALVASPDGRKLLSMCSNGQADCAATAAGLGNMCGAELRERGQACGIVVP